ncbi:hypothetical protein MLPF_0513 [Mycobacterium lepromatosis]|nr:hypothetical protein MLPF_0513 [Mycobacterium lepromatosis]
MISRVKPCICAFGGTGQSISIAADNNRVENHDEIATSRPDFLPADIGTAQERWEELATLLDSATYRWIILSQIQDHVQDAGLIRT